MLDELDQKILELIQVNNQLTHSQISQSVGLSPSSVRRRLKELRESGVIERDVSILRPGKTYITVIAMVSFLQESVDGYQDFKRRMIEAPEVAQCYAVAGEVDFVLIVHAPDLESYEIWGQANLMSDPTIRRYDTHVAWSRVKFSTATPLLQAATTS